MAGYRYVEVPSREGCPKGGVGHAQSETSFRGAMYRAGAGFSGMKLFRSSSARPVHLGVALAKTGGHALPSFS